MFACQDLKPCTRPLHNPARPDPRLPILSPLGRVGNQLRSARGWPWMMIKFDFCTVPLVDHGNLSTYHDVLPKKVCLAQLVQFLSKAHWFGKRSRDWPIWAARPRGSQLLTCDVHRYGEGSQEYKGPPLLWHHEKTHGLWLIDRDLPVCDHALKDSQKSNKTWYFNGETVKYLGTIRIWGWSLIYIYDICTCIYMYIYIRIYNYDYIHIINFWSLYSQSPGLKPPSLYPLWLWPTPRFSARGLPRGFRPIPIHLGLVDWTWETEHDWLVVQ